MTEAEQKRLLVEVRMIKGLLLLMLQVAIYLLKLKNPLASNEFYENTVSLNKEYQDAISKL